MQILRVSLYTIMKKKKMYVKNVQICQKIVAHSSKVKWLRKC